MAEHPWCRDVARDEAVRAAEDAVERPAVPDWRDLPERVARLEAMIPKIVSGSPAESHENEGERMRESAPADRSSVVRFSRRHAMASEAREWCEENGVPASPVNVVTALFSLGLVALPSEAEAEVERLRAAAIDHANSIVAEMEAERDAAIRERDAALARVAELEAREEAAYVDYVLENLKRERDAAIERRDHLEAANRNLDDGVSAAFIMLDREKAKVAALEAERDAALARVAELEAQAKLAPTANVGGGANQPDAEPVAWGVVHTRSDEMSCAWISADDAQEEADCLPFDTSVVPLFRSPQQPRGWLTEDEREAVAWAADETRSHACSVFVLEGGPLKNPPSKRFFEKANSLIGLLRRTAPPKVVQPKAWDCGLNKPLAYKLSERDSAWIAALAAAGVEVEE